MTAPAEVAVVGGGITGLAAAWELSRTEVGDRPPRVVVLETDVRLGGKIDTLDLAGQGVDTGPDAFLARVPEAVALCRELVLDAELIAPATNRALVWSRGRLRPIPDDTVLGVPTRLRTLAAARIVSFGGLARAGLDLVLPATTLSGDRSVASLVDARLGREVRQRLVDPLLGGIHAGSTEQLSLAATAPQVDMTARQHRSLLRGLRTLPAPDEPAAARPVFLTLPGGLGRLVERLANELSGRGVELRTAAPVRQLERVGGHWQLATPQGPLAAHAVVLTVPSFAAAGLLARPAPDAAAELDAIEHASVALVTLAYPSSATSLPRAVSGFLVPRVDGRLMTACTLLSTKWPHLEQPGRALLRVSAGRWQDDRAMRLDDDELVRRLHAELGAAIGVSAPPDVLRVGRWPRSFPQYQVDHLDRVARVHAALARQPGLVVAGASYEGVGIPACIGQGRRAARAVLDHLATSAAR